MRALKGSAQSLCTHTCTLSIHSLIRGLLYYLFDKCVCVSVEFCVSLSWYLVPNDGRAHKTFKYVIMLNLHIFKAHAQHIPLELNWMRPRDIGEYLLLSFFYQSPCIFFACKSFIRWHFPCKRDYIMIGFENVQPVPFLPACVCGIPVAGEQESIPM